MSGSITIKSLFLHVALPLLMTLLMHPKSTSASLYVYSLCSNMTMFRNNSQYQTNLDALFDSLSSNATANNIGFYNTSVATGTSDAVYGIFLCRGDQNATSCSDCVKNATTTDLKTSCPNRKVAIIWYEICMVRYSNESFFGRVDVVPRVILYNFRDGSGNRFANNVNDTLNNLGEDAAADTSGRKYATRVFSFSNSLETFYGLAQCTPDLTTSDCERCMKVAIKHLRLQEGSRVLLPSCNIRYEIYPFFNNSRPTNSLPPQEVISLSPPPLAATPPSPNAVKQSSSATRKTKRSITIAVATIVPIVVLGLLIALCTYHFRKKQKKYISRDMRSVLKDFTTLESLMFDFRTLQVATEHFSDDQKLGQGGFGDVYKGILENGQEIAVKRLSGNSRQGNDEFKNEVALVAKFRHKNLVTLLGFCVSSEEKMIVYEFLPKSSLDKFLNDQTLRQTSLNWQTRFKIIVGIARGLLYLHEDSPLKVIHRDLKSSNILLDDDMNPKIADFGLAKLFGVDQTQGDTKRIVGTYGYMAPEYAITGHYSVKSDVYSFGVIILELVSGQMNRFYRRIQLEEALLHRAWRLWNEGESIALVDKTLNNEEFSREEVSKCIHIGLLCIQEDATLRPRMTSIVAVLNGQANNFPMPKPPNFFGTVGNVDDNGIQHNSIGVYTGSRTITDLYSRD